jgi:serine/threonine protein kinase
VLQGMGVAQLVWLPASQNIARMSSRSSAPELVLRLPGPACDQYSLALIFHELLTGAYPSPGSRPSAPCLDRLAPSDRTLVTPALHPDPAGRWESPLELLRALEAATGPADTARGASTRLTQTMPVPASLKSAIPATVQVRFGTNLLMLPHSPLTRKITVPARIVRMHAGSGGWLEAGAVLMPPAAVSRR